MTQLSIRAVGLDKIQTGLTQFSKTIEPVCRESLREALERARKVSPGYLGGNSYTTPYAGTPRTGNLGRSFAVNVEGLSVRLQGGAYSKQGYEYGHRVLGTSEPGSQAAPWAAIGWVPLRSAVDDEIVKLTGGELDKQLGEAARAAGL